MRAQDADPDTRRLFFGLSVDERVGEQLLRAGRRSLRQEDHGVLHHQDDLHLTLCFLGDFPGAAMTSLLRTASDEFRGLFAPELRVGGGGEAFPSRDDPRVIYATVEEQAETCGRLWTLRNRTLQVGLSHGWRPKRADRERPFTPHVTLGYPGQRAAQELDDFWDLASERKWLPLDITLYESPDQRAPKDGSEARYRPIAAWPLAVRPG